MQIKGIRDFLDQGKSYIEIGDSVEKRVEDIAGLVKLAENKHQKD